MIPNNNQLETLVREGGRQSCTTFPDLWLLFIYNDILIDIGEGSAKYIAHITETPHGLQKAKIVYRYKSTSPNFLSSELVSESAVKFSKELSPDLSCNNCHTLVQHDQIISQVSFWISNQGRKEYKYM